MDQGNSHTRRHSLWTQLFGNLFFTLNIHLPYDLAVLLPVIYLLLREIKIHVFKKDLETAQTPINRMDNQVPSRNMEINGKKWTWHSNTGESKNMLSKKATNKRVTLIWLIHIKFWRGKLTYRNKMGGCLGQKVWGEGEENHLREGRRKPLGDGVTAHGPHFRRGYMDIYNWCNSLNWTLIF